MSAFTILKKGCAHSREISPNHQLSMAVAQLGGGAEPALRRCSPVRAIGPIVIDVGVQSRGIGRRLMEVLLERARGAKSIRLVQGGFNLQSLSLYASLGFDVKEPLMTMTGRPTQSAAKGYLIRHLKEADIAECEALHMGIVGYSRTNELSDRLAEGSPVVAVRNERVVGYLSSPTRAFDNHGIADSDEAMQSLLSGAAELTDAPLLFHLPIGPLSIFFNSEAVNLFRHHLIFEFLGVAGELP